MLIYSPSFRVTHVARTVIKGLCEALPVSQKPRWSRRLRSSEVSGPGTDPLKRKLAKLSEQLQLLWLEISRLAPLLGPL